MKNLFKIIPLLFLIWSCSSNQFKYTESPSGIVFSCNGIKKRVEFYGENILRVSVVGIDRLFKDSSLVVIANSKRTDFLTEDNPDHLILKTRGMNVKIDKNNGALVFLDSLNRIYFSEHPVKLPTLKDTLIADEHQYSIFQPFQITDGEGIYGLGQFQNGFMNYRNKDLELVQANKISIVPLLVSTNNYGILWDNYSHSEFHDGEDCTSFSSEIADQIDYYFIAGDNMDGVISGYRKLTGKAPMFSKKAFGYWQSKERYKSFAELHDVVKKYRENNIPIDNIVQDWRYWGDGKYWSSMYFEPEFYSNPEQNIKELHGQHVDLMVSIWPCLGDKSEIFQEMETNGFLYNQNHWCGGKVYDAYSPKAREIYWKHIQKGLAEKGVDAFWMDGTEPEFSSTDDQEVTEKEILKVGKTHAGSAAKYLNTYSLVTTDGVYRQHRKYTDKKRAFILTRSAWAGQQRNGAVSWSGDVSANYSNLKKQVAAGINFCMAGIPYWTHDIGAFFPTGRGGMYPKGIEDPAYRELYVRWFQFGAFSPIFRSHGTGTPREVWQFKNRDPKMYEALLKSLKLRYRLLPYIYSETWQITSNDYTLMRGLPMDFAEDENTREIADEYMFGQSFLVKPVTKNMYYEIPSLPDAVPAENLQTPDNKPGMQVTFFEGKEFEKELYQGVDKGINHNWGGGGLPQGVPETNFSARWEGSVIADESGIHKFGFTSDDGVRIWFNKKLVVDEWKSGSSTYYFSKDLEKGKKYPVKIEYFQGKGGAIARLGWFTPAYARNQKALSKFDSVYLPQSKGWYDFWTNEFYTGQQTVSKEYPIDIFPLFVKAGSVIPYGPEVQYADEKTDNPMEIRIYAGDNGAFTFYEDEGNNYNYEDEKYNTIEFRWNDDKKLLTIGESSGNFEGFIKEKRFKIVLIDSTQQGEDKNIKAQKEIFYVGESMEINFN